MVAESRADVQLVGAAVVVGFGRSARDYSSRPVRHHRDALTLSRLAAWRAAMRQADPECLPSRRGVTDSDDEPPQDCYRIQCNLGKSVKVLGRPTIAFFLPHKTNAILTNNQEGRDQSDGNTS